MKKYFSFNNLVIVTTVTVTVFLLTSLTSCNKKFGHALGSDNDTTSYNKGIRKTLLIIVDGAVGREVKAAGAPTLNQLTDFSIYSWDALADFKKTDVTNPMGWSNLLTGVTSDKHGVTGNDFSDNDFVDYPSLFTRLKNFNPDWRTSAFCSSPALMNNLLTNATEKKSFNGDDGAVADAAVNEMNSQDPSLVLVQFHDVDKAGQEGSYSVSDPNYKATILKTDEYIGNILAAMRARQTFKDENWMVIITSDKGSDTPDDAAGAARNSYEDSRRNTFFICYNPRFNSINPTKPGTIIPYIGTSPLYDGNNANSYASVTDGGNTYDFGSSGSFTIQCKVKVKPGAYFYPSFLSKRAEFSPGIVGWVFFFGGETWVMNFGQNGKGNVQISGNHPIYDNSWHTLTAVIKQEGAARNVYTYTDGIFSGNHANIADLGDISSPAPFTVGWNPGSRNPGSYSPTGYYVNDVRIYNTALDESYIAANYCKTYIDPTDPYAGNVLGFWPSTSIEPGKRLEDLSSNQHDMVVDELNSVAFNDLSPLVCPSISDGIYKSVPNSIDVVQQIYQWFGILVPASWMLDGKNWIPTYSDVNG